MNTKYLNTFRASVTRKVTVTGGHEDVERQGPIVSI